MNPWRIWAEVIGMILIVLALIFGASTIWGWRKAALANAEVVHQQAATANTTGDIAQNLGKKTTDTQRVDVVVTQERGKYEAQYSQLKTSDPDVADWAAGRVPQRLRDLARSRRAARDGLGAPEAGGPPVDPAQDGARTGAAPGPG